MDIEKMSCLDLEMMLNRPFYRCEYGEDNAWKKI